MKHILFGGIFGRQTILPGAINSLIHESLKSRSDLHATAITPLSHIENCTLPNVLFTKVTSLITNCGTHGGGERSADVTNGHKRCAWPAQNHVFRILLY